MNYQMQPTPSVGLKEAARLYFNKATDTRSRSRRSEYWMAVLFLFLVNFVGGMAVTFVAALLGDVGAFLAAAVFIIWSLICLVASISLCIRRLHDTGKSGWWYLLMFVPVGSIVLLVFFCMDSTEDNKWGPNPKFAPSAPASSAPAAFSAPVRPASVPVRRDYEDVAPVSRQAYTPYQGQTQTAFSTTVPATAQVPVMEATPAVYGTLRLYSGPMAGKSFRFPEGTTVTLGRSRSRCQVALPDYNVVSGEHCRITICNNYINITDLGSTNGTFVNGIRLTPHKTVSARPGANIYLANNTCALRVLFE